MPPWGNSNIENVPNNISTSNLLIWLNWYLANWINENKIRKVHDQISRIRMRQKLVLNVGMIIQSSIGCDRKGLNTNIVEVNWKAVAKLLGDCFRDSKKICSIYVSRL